MFYQLGTNFTNLVLGYDYVNINAGDFVTTNVAVPDLYTLEDMALKAYIFSATVPEYIGCTGTLPYTWDESTNIRPYIVMQSKDAGTADQMPYWKINIKVKDTQGGSKQVNPIMDNPTPVGWSAGNNIEQYKLYIFEGSDLDLSTIQHTAGFFMDIHRQADSGSDTFPHEPQIVAAGITYKIGQLGIANPYA